MADAAPRRPTVFLSYASENREAARRIGAALPAFGLEVWYDESELGGGDAWDQKIRRQIRECDYFMAIVSAQTEARREGYFRREWRLAAERTLDMADDHLFLLPVVIDETDATHARVPEKFQTVQWLRLPDGQSTPALEALGRRLASGDTAIPPPRASLHPGGLGTGVSPASPPSAPSAPSEPEPDEKAPYRATPFPHHEPGQSVRFGFDVLGWMFRNVWGLWRLIPRWIRWMLIIWACIALMSRCSDSGSSSRHRAAPDQPPVPPATQKKIDDLTSQYTQDPGNLSKIGELVAREVGKAGGSDGAPLMALPFTAPGADAATTQLAHAAFAQTYARLAVTHHGGLSLSPTDPVEDCNLKELLRQGNAREARYVLCGRAEVAASAPARLEITLVDVDKDQEHWHGSYPVAGADAAKIAKDVAAHVPKAARDKDKDE